MATVRGTLTRTWGPGAFFLQDETGAIFVRNEESHGPVRAGDSVEVSGPIVSGGMTPHLHARRLRVIGRGKEPAPVALGVPEAFSARFDCALVRLRGRIHSERNPASSDRAIFIETAGFKFPIEAAPEDVDGAPWPRLRAGDSIEATGVLSVRGPEDASPWLIRLLARSRRDVEVLGPPPWWMPPRIYQIAAIGIAAALAVLGWVAILRRQVRRQTALLRAQYEKDAALERHLQESQKLESLGVLAGGIAHDFNNLLTAILGHASLGKEDTPLHTPLHESFDQIEKAGERAAELCRQMLAYSGRGRFVIAAVDLNALIREMAELLRASVSKKAMLSLALCPSEPSVAGDSTQVRQVVMSLVINASEALGDKEGLVTVATGVSPGTRAELDSMQLGKGLPECEYAFIEVRDTGAGMDAQTRARIFEPFFSTKFAGRGLGLAAVLGIVRSHQGALKVTSAVGQGTTFRLLLPATARPSAKPPTAGRVTSESLRGMVLVVDDEESVRHTVQRMLESAGCQIVTARDGAEGVEKFRESPESYAAVLLDLTMPRLDGLETLRALRKLRPEVRVLLMSGYSEADALSRFAGEALTGFLQKPFTPTALRRKLESVLG